MLQSNLIYVLILLSIGVAFTVWVFQKRRHLERGGFQKGVAKFPKRVKRDNPPDDS